MTSLNIGREQSLHQASSERAMQLRRLQMGRLQEHLSTGLRVNRASDDPTAFAEARHLERLGERYAQYQRSIDASQSWVDHTQDALDGLGEQLTVIYERGLRARSNVFDADDRDAEASRLENLVDEIVSTLNMQDGDEYLFAGTRTTARPFDQVGTVVTYNGNTGSRTRQIGDDLRIAVNVSGDRVLDTGAGFTITESVQDMADAVRSGDPAQFETALDRVVSARDHVLELGTEAGSIANRLDLSANQLREAVLRVDGRRSELEDTDLATTLFEFQEAQTGLQAALQVTASVLQTSLLDYLR